MKEPWLCTKCWVIKKRDRLKAKDVLSMTIFLRGVYSVNIMIVNLIPDSLLETIRILCNSLFINCFPILKICDSSVRVNIVCYKKSFMWKIRYFTCMSMVTSFLVDSWEFVLASVTKPIYMNFETLLCRLRIVRSCENQWK